MKQPTVLLLGLLTVFGCTQAYAQDPFTPDQKLEPTISMMSAADVAFVADPPAKRMAEFRRSLLTAAEQSFRDGDLTRAELVRIRLTTLNPKTCAKLHQCCCEQMVCEGRVQSGMVAAIDWSKALAILKELIPVILQIISLF
jgi:hypothetical protein